MKERFEKMFNVEIIRIEEVDDKIVVYVFVDKVRIVVGSGGVVVKVVEFVIGKKIEVRFVE